MRLVEYLIMIFHNHMKRLLIGLLLMALGKTAQAQTWETGLAINTTHLWQSPEYAYLKNRTDGLGLSLMARYQNPKATYLVLKNNEVGLELSRGQIEVQARGQHAGARTGITTSINYSTSSLSLNNYFINFGTLNKEFQVALGIHCNYKITTLSEGFTEVLHYEGDTNFSGYRVWFTKNSLNGRNNQLIERFNLGPTLRIALPPFDVGKFKLRCRYDMNVTLRDELKEGNDFNYLRQRFTLSFVWADLNSNRSLEKFKVEK